MGLLQPEGGWSGATRDGWKPSGGWRVTLGSSDPSHTFFYGDTNDYYFITLLREAMPGVRKGGERDANSNDIGQPYEPPRHSGGNNFAFVDGHVQWLPFPTGRWSDGGPWVVPDMSMYSRTGRWETQPVRSAGY